MSDGRLVADIADYETINKQFAKVVYNGWGWESDWTVPAQSNVHGIGNLPLPDAALLFTVMIGVVLVPISIGGWGLRELAVISLLATYGVAPERALLFSVCFGLALAVGSLPGALAWLLYPFPAKRSAERGG